MESNPIVSNSINPEVPAAVSQPAKSKPVPAWMVGVLILIIGIMIGFGTRSYLAGPGVSIQPPLTDQISDTNADSVQNLDQKISGISSQVQFFSPPKTNRKSFPVTKDGLLRLVSVVPGDLVIKYPEDVAGSGYSFGKGFSEPSSSPDMAKIALITQKGQLRVIDSEGRSVASVGANLKVGYISGWSPDSQKLIFYVFGSKISNMIFPDGPVLPESVDQNPKFTPGAGIEGFYVLDFMAQKIEFLAPISDASFLAWIDAKTILVTVKNFGQGPEVAAAFNVETYQARAGEYKDIFKDWFGPQMSFSPDGKKWAITLHSAFSVGDDSTAAIILADFPARSGVTIESGKFAYIQGPRISPDSKKVIYRAHDVVNGPNFVQLYDGSQTKRLFEGIPLEWIDANSFIYAVFSPNFASNLTMAQNYFKYDLTTGQSVELLNLANSQ